MQMWHVSKRVQTGLCLESLGETNPALELCCAGSTQCLLIAHWYPFNADFWGGIHDVKVDLCCNSYCRVLFSLFRASRDICE